VSPDIFLKLLGQNLQKARRAKGLTLDQAAGGRGAYRYLWELEAGRRNPTVMKLLQLAELYDVAPADLLNVEGARPQKGKRLSESDPEPAKRGRKPKGHPRSR
jgi:transcriptional regulator with XRE-family HTH domain